MKHLFFSIVLLIITYSGYSQELHVEVEKGDWMMVVKNKNNLVQNYKLAGKALLDAGYQIKSSDVGIGYITSDIFTAHDPIGGAHYLRISISVEDSIIKLMSQSAIINSNERLPYPKFYQVIFEKKVLDQLGLIEHIVSLAHKIGDDVYFAK